jgi:hypothetical protein
MLAYAEFRRTRAQQSLAARHHCRQRSKAAVLGAWLGAARYLAPIRRALTTIMSKVWPGAEGVREGPSLMALQLAASDQR